MPSPIGNSNAEKWTLQATLDKLDDLEYYAGEERIYTLGTALGKANLYMGIWTYWKKRWADHEEIMDKMAWIDQVFINKIVEGALNKRLHAGMAMFILKAKYNMRDKPLRKDEHLPEEQVPPHLQADLDRIEAEKKAAQTPPTTSVQEKQIAVPTLHPDALPQRTIGQPVYTSYSEAQPSTLQAPQDYHAESDSWLNKEVAQRAAA
jgi:hypothetical protein